MLLWKVCCCASRRWTFWLRQSRTGPGYGDDQLLALAANQGRIVLTHDRQTMIGFANSRVSAGLRMPGMIVVKDQWAPGPLIEDILIILFAGLPGELEDRVLFVPM